MDRSSSMDGFTSVNGWIASRQWMDRNQSMDGRRQIHPWIDPLRPARATAPSRPKRECNPPPEPRFAAAVFRIRGIPVGVRTVLAMRCASAQASAVVPLRFAEVGFCMIDYIGAEKRKNGKTGLRKTDLKNGKNEIPEHVGFAFGSYIRFSRAVFQPFSTPGKTPVFHRFFQQFFQLAGESISDARRALFPPCRVPRSTCPCCRRPSRTRDRTSPGICTRDRTPPDELAPPAIRRDVRKKPEDAVRQRVLGPRHVPNRRIEQGPTRAQICRIVAEHVRFASPHAINRKFAETRRPNRDTRSS